MQKYKIIVAYDGTDYFGWQRQKDLPTVAQALEDSFFSVFGQRVPILGVSRTDAGVHALGQVAQFRTEMQIDPKIMQQAWTNILPSDITIKSLEPVDLRFNPHCNLISKTYHYHFFTKRPLPTVQRFGWFYRYPVCMKKLHDALSVFIGTHDFRSFCTGDERADTVRTIDSVSVEWVPEFGAYRIEIRGPKFLRYMIRRIVGACLEVASRNHLPVFCLRKAIDKKDPEQTLPNAPAKGLMLHGIEYKQES